MPRLLGRPIVACLALSTMMALRPADLSAQSRSACQPTVAGTLELVPLVSNVLHNQRFLRVWTPPEYSDPSNGDKRYAALYVLDGDLIFGDCPYGMKSPDMGMDETVSSLVATGAIQPMIIVGIESVAREYELLPYRDPFFRQDLPEPIGRRFPEFLAQDVVPAIAKRYRVAAGPQAIAGWSYGAVAALWALLTRPDLFDVGLLESPSLGIGNGQLLRDTQHLMAAPERVFIGAGDSEFPTESENLGYLRSIATVEEHLKGAFQKQSQVKTVITPGAKHSIAASAQRLDQAMLFLFGK